MIREPRMSIRIHIKTQEIWFRCTQRSLEEEGIVENNNRHGWAYYEEDGAAPHALVTVD